MKLKNYLLLLMPLLFASCSDDDNNSTANEELTLQKIITYIPSLDAYNDPLQNEMALKKIQYYENGAIVHDSVFDRNGAYFGKTEHTTLGNTRTETMDWAYGTINFNQVYTYDQEGRLTSFENTQYTPYKHFFSYEDNSITVAVQNPDTGELSVFGVFTKNDLGIITSSNSYPYEDTLVFSSARPVELLRSSDDWTENINFTYYDTEVPENARKSPTEINNLLLTLDVEHPLSHVARYSDRYIKSYDGLLNFESAFNDSGYITHCKLVNVDYYEYPWESFYYYNE